MSCWDTRSDWALGSELHTLAATGTFSEKLTGLLHEAGARLVDQERHCRECGEVIPFVADPLPFHAPDCEMRRTAAARRIIAEQA